MHLCLIFSLVSLPLAAKVDPKNYDFSTDTLKDFFPGTPLSELEKKYGKAEVLRERTDPKQYRFWVSQLRYKFPVIVQSDGQVVLDMFARLPSYFLHDIFHQSLITRWGKQSFHKRVDEEAFYRWESAEHVMFYGASCTITCFPVYFSVAPAAEKRRTGFTPLHDALATRQ